MPESVDIPRGVSSADLLRAQEAARWQEIRNYNEAVNTSQTQRLTDMLNRNAPPPTPSGNAPVGVSGVPDSIPNPYMSQADRAATYSGPSQRSLYRGEIELANDYEAEVARRARAALAGRAAQAGSGNVAVDAPGGPRPVNTPGGGQLGRVKLGQVRVVLLRMPRWLAIALAIRSAVAGR
jgi:hypothetical protein